MTPYGVAAAAFVGSGVLFVVATQVARRRAVARRGASVRVATGPAQIVPYFIWVPYAVVVLRLGPEVEPSDVVRALGALLTVGGVAFSLWAVATLGRHYDLVLEIHEGHEIVRDGPFGLVRHPVYTGLALHFLGACAATGDLLLLSGTLAVIVPALYARASAEERLLREQFGAEYERYAREVPMLVPFIR